MLTAVFLLYYFIFNKRIIVIPNEVRNFVKILRHCVPQNDKARLFYDEIVLNSRFRHIIVKYAKSGITFENVRKFGVFISGEYLSRGIKNKVPCINSFFILGYGGKFKSIFYFGGFDGRHSGSNTGILYGQIVLSDFFRSG